MKNIILPIIAFICMPVNVFAAVCETRTGCTNGSNTIGSYDYCIAGHNGGCYYVESITTSNVYWCTKCSGNRTLKQVRAGTCTNISGTECVCSNNCKDVAWTAGNTGYEYSVQCGSACDATKKYRCAKGYYGTSTNGTSGCTRCPASGGTYGTTASAGATSITSCYLPSGSSFSDSTGSGTIVGGNCYYKN
ncbi:MAG: hypothetical protein K2L25_02345 [Alphaproteobacteria bacterium]|nr:hypothetical protein [Alphaproteobacteria bacterium]